MRTPIYGLDYLAEGEPAYQTRLRLEQMTFTVEDVLRQRGLTPPDGSADYLSLVGRVNTLDAATAPTRLTLGATGATHYTDANFDGVNYWRRGKTVTVAGAFTAAVRAISPGEVLGILPAGHRPPKIVPTAGVMLHVRTTGEVIAGAAIASGATVSFSATFVIA